MKYLSILLLVIACSLPSRAAADIFTISDSDFANNVYDFTYFSTTNRAYVNGVELPFSSLVMTNTGLSGPTAEGNVAYWHASGYFSANQLAGDITMGWDLSGVSKQIEQVDFLTNAVLGQFSPWTRHAFGDKLYGEIATPAAFGGGGYSRYFEYEGNNQTNTLTNFNELQDVTSVLSNSWLADPNLLELRLGYEQHSIDTAHANIPGKHLQVFRNGFGGSEGFRLRILATDSAAVPEPSAIAGIVFLSAFVFLRRRSRAVKTTTA